jgi:hypothetical protein
LNASGVSRLSQAGLPSKHDGQAWLAPTLDLNTKAICLSLMASSGEVGKLVSTIGIAIGITSRITV